jgi:ATP-dependent Lon protease
VGRIPEPLLSRLTLYQIEPPDAEGAARIARTIYGEIRNSHDWGKHFPEALSASAIEKLAALPPREMRRAIHSAFGNAKIAGRSEVGCDDIQDPRSRKQRIGF